jgi:hypothetical protein
VQTTNAVIRVAADIRDRLAKVRQAR